MALADKAKTPGGPTPEAFSEPAMFCLDGCYRTRRGDLTLTCDSRAETTPSMLTDHLDTGNPRASKVRPEIVERDPRMEAFASWLYALDRNDVAAMKIANRRLRSLRFSLCLLSPSITIGGKGR